MNCLIAGASGLVGGELLKILLNDSHFTKIVSIARRSLQIENPKLIEIQTPLEKVEAFILPASDIAFCCLGTTIKKAGSQENFKKVDHDYVLNFARAAKKAGVEKFIIVTAMGADANSAVFYNRVKGQVENDLKKMGFASLVILQPSLLLGDRSERRPLEKFFIQSAPVINKILIGPLAQYQAVPASKVAASMSHAALNPTSVIHQISNTQIAQASPPK